MKKFAFLFFCLGFCGYLNSQNKYVYLGEIDERTSDFSIRLDGDGELYPDYNIPVSNLTCFMGSLDRHVVKNIFEKKCDLRSEILRAYNLPSSLSYDNIHDSLVKFKLVQINSELLKQNIDNVTFIMVGFNNSYCFTDSTCANYKLALLRRKINSYLLSKNKKSLIVNVYWDGTEAKTRIVNGAIHLSNSSVTSTWAGLGLREIINGLKCNKVQMVSHSMGANIIAESIFNQRSKFKSHKFRRELAKSNKVIPPPTKIIRVAMVAPAIPGVNTFTDYLNSDSKNTNCTFIIGYNTNDETLLKSFGVLPVNPNHFSSTSLGCREIEVRSVEDLFIKSQLAGNFIKKDFSFIDGVPQFSHDLEVYMLNPMYAKLLDALYN